MEMKRIFDEQTAKEAGAELVTRYQVQWLESLLTTDELVNAPELLRKGTWQGAKHKTDSGKAD